jgi:choline-sulfatase
MKSKFNNFLVIMSDEHNPKILGRAGHPIIETPHLDSLIDRGTYFKNTYTTSPVAYQLELDLLVENISIR